MGILEIIINEMMAGDGPVPTDLGNVDTHDAETTQGDVWNRVQSRQGSRQERTKRSRTVVSWKTELMHGRVAKEMTEARRAPRAANQIGTVTKTKDEMEAKAKVKVRATPDIARIAESTVTSE